MHWALSLDYFMPLTLCFQNFFLMWLSLGIATSITTAFFCCLLTNMISGWLAITSLSVCIWKSHRILAWSFSTTLGGVFHFDLGTSSPHSPDVPVHYASHVVMVFHVRCSCLHLTTCCYVLNCLRGIFAQPAQSCLVCCAECLFLCCVD